MHGGKAQKAKKKNRRAGKQAAHEAKTITPSRENMSCITIVVVIIITMA